MNQDIFIVCAKKNWRTLRSHAFEEVERSPRGAAARRQVPRAGCPSAWRGGAWVDRPLDTSASDAEAHDDLVAVAHHVAFFLDVLQARRLYLALRAEPHEVVNSHNFGPNKASSEI